jgi:hypothetical protein
VAGVSLPRTRKNERTTPSPARHAAPLPRQAAAAQPYSVNGSTRGSILPPADLNALEKVEFIAVVTGSPPSHFLPCDIATISAYARAVVAERRAAGELDAAPVIDGKPSPWLPVWMGALRACTTLARRLNIGPSGRLPTKPAEPDAPISYYQRQRMLEGRQDDDAAN